MNHRLFLALPFPQELVSKIQSLKSNIKFPLNWEPVEKLHLTLNFLGNITDDLLPTLQKSLTSILNPARIATQSVAGGSFKIHFGFLSSQYRRHEGSFIYLSPDQPSDELIQLQEDLKSNIYHLDIPVADRFWPHITIARIPKADPVTTKTLLDQIDNLNLKVRFTWLVDQVVLFESKSDRTGSHYTRLATYHLS